MPSTIHSTRINRIKILVASQINIIAHLVDAEAHDRMDEVQIEAQALADTWRKPLVLLDRNNQRLEFQPQKGTICGKTWAQIQVMQMGNT